MNLALTKLLRLHPEVKHHFEGSDAKKAKLCIVDDAEITADVMTAAGSQTQSVVTLVHTDGSDGGVSATAEALETMQSVNPPVHTDKSDGGITAFPEASQAPMAGAETDNKSDGGMSASPEASQARMAGAETDKSNGGISALAEASRADLDGDYGELFDAWMDQLLEKVAEDAAVGAGQVGDAEVGAGQVGLGSPQLLVASLIRGRQHGTGTDEPEEKDDDWRG